MKTTAGLERFRATLTPERRAAWRAKISATMLSRSRIRRQLRVTHGSTRLSSDGYVVLRVEQWQDSRRYIKGTHRQIKLLNCTLTTDAIADWLVTQLPSLQQPTVTKRHRLVTL